MSCCWRLSGTTRTTTTIRVSLYLFQLEARSINCWELEEKCLLGCSPSNNKKTTRRLNQLGQSVWVVAPAAKWLDTLRVWWFIVSIRSRFVWPLVTLCPSRPVARQLDGQKQQLDKRPCPLATKTMLEEAHLFWPILFLKLAAPAVAGPVSHGVSAQTNSVGSSQSKTRSQEPVAGKLREPSAL